MSHSHSVWRNALVSKVAFILPLLVRGFTLLGCISLLELTVLVRLSIVDFLADLFLISFPIAVLWSVRLPVVERRLVFALFSCSILTIMSSVFFGTLGLVPLRLLGPDAFLLLDMGGQLQV